MTSTLIVCILSLVFFQCHCFVLLRHPKALQKTHRIQLFKEETVLEDNVISADNFFSKKTFQDMKLKQKLLDALTAMDITVPSKIQWIAHHTIMKGKSTILADQTGSGKTLGYLIPAFQMMMERHELENRNPSNTEEWQSPGIVVIAPTTELANQVARVVRALSHVLKHRSCCFTTLSDNDAEEKKLRVGVDILVVTPGTLRFLLNKKKHLLEKTKTIVLDEADVLFMDETFPLQQIGEKCPADAQFIFATATLPPLVMQQIKAEFPGVVEINGPGLHRIAPNIVETIIDCSGESDDPRNSQTIYNNKEKALLEVINDPANSKIRRTLIFCNTIDQCRRVENSLSRTDRHEKIRKVLAYHSAIEMRTRDENIMKFSRPLINRNAVLISTDRASRGMDFDKAVIDHVILFDFPQEPSEYIRRVGRTGRVGRPGKVTILAFGRQVRIARDVIDSTKSGKKIVPNVAQRTVLPTQKERQLAREAREAEVEERKRYRNTDETTYDT